MVLAFKKGTILAPIAGATPFDIAYTGVGFQPKALIFFYTKQTGVGGANPMSGGLGFGTAPNEARDFIGHSDDGVATTNVRQDQEDNSCIGLLVDGDGAPELRGDLKSLDADGFTITWGVRASANAYIIHYIALGGDDLTDVKSESITLPTVSGNTSFIGVGFQPDLVLIATVRRTSWTSGVGFTPRIGAAISSSKRWCATNSARDGRATSDVNRRFTQSQFILMPNAAGNDEGQADFVSMDPDGFTINVAVGEEFASAYVAGYLALKGGQYDVGGFAKSISGAPANQAVTGVGFEPVGIILVSVGSPTLDAIVNDGELDIGGGDIADMGSIWLGDENAQATTNTMSRTETNAVLTNGEITDGSEETGAIINTLDADGFTLTLDPNSANADQFGYLAFGNAEAPSATLPPYGQVIFNSADEENRPRYGQRIARGTEE